MSSMRYYGYCPLHEWERPECTQACNPIKDELWRLNRAYDALWKERANGHVPRTPARSAQWGHRGGSHRRVA